MANFRIWAPWRLAYVKDASKDIEEECIFCAKPAADDDEANLIVHRGEHCFVILNLFPYTNGHLMVAPYDHVGRLQEIPAETLAEMMALAQQAMERLESVYQPHGFNVGFNQGRVAGAGVEHHIHMHVVPRWAGDNNFMPVIADTKVMPQSIEQSYEALKGAFLNDQSPLAPPGIFKAYDIRGLYGEEMDETTARAIGRAFARVLGRLRGKQPSELRVGLGRDMRLTAPADGGGGARRAYRRGRACHRRRAGRDRDALPPGRLARARRRRDGHRLPQPQGLHRGQARPRGRPAALRRRRHRRRQGRDRSRARRRAGRRLGGGSRRLGRIPRPCALLHRPGEREADEGRGRRRQRHGRADGRPDPRAAAAGARGDVLRARRRVPRPRAEPAAGGEPADDHRPGQA